MVFQLYHRSQIYCWRKPEYPKKTRQKDNTGGLASGAGTAYPSGEPEIDPPPVLVGFMLFDLWKTFT